MVLLALLITSIFTGLHIKNNEGQYKGYVVSLEQDGVIFKGYTVYLKTDLQSSNEDVACVNRDDKELIEKLKESQGLNEPIILDYEGMIIYGIGECPKSDWMIMGIRSN